MERKPNRLTEYDYSTTGAYFIAICTQDRKKILSPTNAVIPHFVSTFKRFCHRDVGEKIFQRSYYDHVIRNQKDYDEIWQYIENNPRKWFLQKHNLL